MAEQVCSKCGILKPLAEFHKKGNKRASQCKACCVLQGKLYYIANKKRINARNKEYVQNNKEKRAAYRLAYNKATTEERHLYYLQNKEKINARNRAWYQANLEKVKEYNETRKPKNNHRDRLLRKTNPKIRLNRNISCAISFSLHGNKKNRHWEDLVGYTLNKLKKHLEKLFLDGMTWENYGRDGWAIDHVIPKSAFNYQEPTDYDFKRCWALKNLQPLWAHDNSVKYNKLTEQFQPALL